METEEGRGSRVMYVVQTWPGASYVLGDVVDESVVYSVNGERL